MLSKAQERASEFSMFRFIKCSVFLVDWDRTVCFDSAASRLHYNKHRGFFSHEKSLNARLAGELKKDLSVLCKTPASGWQNNYISADEFNEDDGFPHRNEGWQKNKKIKESVINNYTKAGLWKSRLTPLCAGLQLTSLWSPLLSHYMHSVIPHCSITASRWRILSNLSLAHSPQYLLI